MDKRASGIICTLSWAADSFEIIFQVSELLDNVELPNDTAKNLDGSTCLLRKPQNHAEKFAVSLDMVAVEKQELFGRTRKVELHDTLVGRWFL